MKKLTLFGVVFVIVVFSNLTLTRRAKAMVLPGDQMNFNMPASNRFSTVTSSQAPVSPESKEIAPVVRSREEIIAVLIDLFGKDIVDKASTHFGFARAIEKINSLGVDNFIAITEQVINLLDQKTVSQAFAKDPYAFAWAIEKINSLGVANFITITEQVINLLGKKTVSQAFAEKPSSFAWAIEEINSLGVDNLIAITEQVINLLGKKTVSQVFANDPYAFAQAIKEINLLGLDNFGEFLALCGVENISKMFASSTPAFYRVIQKIRIEKDGGKFGSAVEGVRRYYFIDFRQTGLYSARIWQEFGIAVWEEWQSLTQEQWQAIYSTLSNMPPEFIQGLSLVIISWFYALLPFDYYGRYESDIKVITMNMKNLSKLDVQRFARVFAHELAHHIDNMYFGMDAFRDLYSRSRFDEDFARDYGRRNHLEDFATTVEYYLLDSIGQFIRAIKQADRGRPIYLEKLLFVLNLFTTGHPDYTIIYRIQENGIVVKKELAVGRDESGKIISIGGVRIDNLDELRKLFERLEV